MALAPFIQVLTLNIREPLLTQQDGRSGSLTLYTPLPSPGWPDIPLILKQRKPAGFQSTLSYRTEA